MALDNPSSLSIVALLSELTGGDWPTAYAALLDLSGTFRSHWKTELPSARTQILDMVAELHLSGRASDASNLLNLTSECENPAVLVLLQCSRLRGRASAADRKSLFRLVPSNEISPDCMLALYPDGKISNSGLANIDAMETAEQVAKGYEASVPQVEVSNEDCIQSAAKFAQDEHRLWLLSKLRRSIDDVHIKRDELYKDIKFVNFFKARHEKAFAYGSRNPKSRMGKGKTFEHDENAHVHDNAFLEHIFNKCITGSYEAQQSMSSLNSVDGTESSSDWKDLSLRRQAATAKRKEAHIFIASRKLQKSEIFDSTTRAAVCGNVYQDVLTFAELYTGAGTGRVFEAVADFAFEVSRNYFCALFESAYSESTATSCRPWLALEVAESYLSRLVSLASLLRDMEQTDRSACAILNTLYDAQSHYSDNRIHCDLFARALGPYATSIKDWVLEGSLQRDLTGEFFGNGLGIQVTASENLHHYEKDQYVVDELHSSAAVPRLLELEEALYILRAGRSRGLVKQFCPDFESRAVTQDSALSCHCPWPTSGHLSPNQTGKAKARVDSSICGASSIGYSSDLVRNWENDVTWQDVLTKAEMAPKMKEPYHGKCFVIPTSLSPSSSAEDKQLRLFTASSRQGQVRGASHLPDYPLMECSSEVFLPLTVLQYSKGMLSPLRLCDDAVQDKVLTHFVEELRVFEHLRNLRAHVLLGAGDFANILVEQIDAAARLSDEHEKYIERRANASLTFYGTSGPGVRSIRDQAHLNRCLRMALNLYSHESSEFSSFLSLDAAEDDMSKRTSLWETTIDVNYNVPYPLNLMFSRETGSMYSKIFNLMLRILRAKKSLRSMFMLSRRKSALRRKAQTRFLSSVELQSVLWHFCWQAEHFVTIFGGFQMDQVLGSTWDSFERTWKSSNTIWDLRDAHVHYLKDCIRRCLLGVTHRSVLGVMSEGFDIVVNVDRQISSAVEEASVWTGVSADDTIDLLTSSSASLRRRLVFLRDVLKRLLDEGTSSHLEDLLVRLSFGKQDFH